MGELESIEKQIERLDDDAFARLRTWFIEYDHSRWDRQIEADSAARSLSMKMRQSVIEFSVAPAAVNCSL
jgi:hypothetical protein